MRQRSLNWARHWCLLTGCSNPANFDEIEAEWGIRDFIPSDLEVESDRDAIIKICAYGALDVLVNNARLLERVLDVGSAFSGSGIECLASSLSKSDRRISSVERLVANPSESYRRAITLLPFMESLHRIGLVF